MASAQDDINNLADTQNEINTSEDFDDDSSESSNEPHHGEPSSAPSALTEIAFSWAEQNENTKAKKVPKGNKKTRKRPKAPPPMAKK